MFFHFESRLVSVHMSTGRVLGALLRRVIVPPVGPGGARQVRNRFEIKCFRVCSAQRGKAERVPGYRETLRTDKEVRCPHYVGNRRIIGSNKIGTTNRD